MNCLESLWTEALPMFDKIPDTSRASFLDPPPERTHARKTRQSHRPHSLLQSGVAQQGMALLERRDLPKP